MSGDPLSGSPLEFAVVSSEKSWYLGQYFSAILLGAQISLAIQSTYYLAQGPHSLRKKAFFIAYSIILAILLVIAVSSTQVIGFLMWITNRDIPGGPEAYLIDTAFSGWIDTLSTSALIASNFIGDAMLLYRCYVLLPDYRFVVLPVLLFITSNVLGILTVIESALPSSRFFAGRVQAFGVTWVALTVAFNVVVTSLICGRIIVAHMSIKRLGVADHAAERWGIIAILIESALPFSVAGIIHSVLFGISNQWVVLIGDVWGSMTGLSPQLIILRVAMGRAWTKEEVSARSALHFKNEGNTTTVFSEKRTQNITSLNDTGSDTSRDKLDVLVESPV
ncbi:hypothetical protein GALMADRAFT_281746 [Galerina marginata CBS 339.88]|uniref:G-protein coupled receptors family 1 profile domain-containing protein n=1 Tax=Galerina marginata (strain CBS 339.88) TaxID=685588 RepID=A0A067SUX3_GALM3|nr:hypothetical protein GALMADRAFT_281746 [Galerina marginata CBS 339.88]